MNCPSCPPQLPLPPPSNVPPLLCPPPPPLSSTPPSPLSRTPPPRRPRTPRSSKARLFNSSVAAGSAVSISSVTFFIVIIRWYIKQGGDKPSNNSGTNKSGNITVPLELSIKISVPDQTVKRRPPSPPDKPTPPDTPTPPDKPTPTDTPTPPDTPCCDSCASDWTLSRRTCYDSNVQGSWTQAYPVEWSAHQAAMGVTEPVNEEYYIEPAEYMWNKLCD